MKCILNWIENKRKTTNVEQRTNGDKRMTRARTKQSLDKAGPMQISLTVDDKRQAERILVRAIQFQHFPTEIANLVKWGIFSPNAMHELKKRSTKLAHLNPYLDEFDVMRAGGRMCNSEILPHDLKFPMILPNIKDEHVKALVRQIHTDNYHCSRIQTYHLARWRWYILGGKTGANKVVDQCVSCQKVGKLPSTQKMGNLPTARMDSVVPFQSVGVDCFGPFLTRQGRGTKKIWVLICTCMVTRAVHLLPLRDMTTNTVINALVKLTSQYPTVRNLYSDKGTNFVGADREIREAKGQWLKEGLNDQLTDMELTWTFGPANCRHAGGGVGEADRDR